METTDFLRRHPRLFHLAHAEAWPSLQESGLLSTRSLVQRSDLDEDEQQRLLTEYRPDAVTLDVPGFSSVVVRDQNPFSIAKLEAALTRGMVTSDWLDLLNSMVFLFPDEASLATFYEKHRAHPCVVLELDARTLVEEYGSLIRLASINTGATVYKTAPRGRETFQGMRQFDAKRKVKEVAVLGGIPDLPNYVCKAERWEPDGTRVPLASSDTGS